MVHAIAPTMRAGSWKPHYRKKCPQPENREVMEGHSGCIFVFYHLFCYMEVCRVLHITNELHLAALHYVFLPRINRNQSLFAEGHDRGPLSLEHNKSPEQLWIKGMLSNSTGRVVEEFNGQVFNF